MSALLLIIILLMMNIVYKLSEEVDKSSQFDKLQEQLYLALEDEFEEDLERLYMEIDSSGVVNFVNPSVLFESNRAQIRPGFAGVLREFFPRYLDVLTGDHFGPTCVKLGLKGTRRQTVPPKTLTCTTFSCRNLGVSMSCSLCCRIPSSSRG